MSARYKHGQKWIQNWKRCAIYARDGFACVYCQELPRYREEQERWTSLLLDHVEPYAGNGEENLVTTCDGCNNWKGERSLDEWLRAREAYGESPTDLALIKQRVALYTFLPLDSALGKRLESLRGKGYGSFAALHLEFQSLQLAPESRPGAVEVRHGA